MRKILFLTALLVCVAAECFASKPIDTDRAAIGGIAIGSKIEYVRSIYGEPTKIGRSPNGNSIDWYYGDTFQITFADGRAVFVCSSGNNGLNTPDDVGVGMKARRVKKVFGRPSEKLKFDKREVYVYEGAGDWQMIFVLNGDWIKEIRLTAETKGVSLE